MFNNWIDPKVMTYYIKDPEESWRKSYGFDFVKEHMAHGSHGSDSFDCQKKCIKAVSFPQPYDTFLPSFFIQENEPFARKCKRKGGLFKCCVTMWRITPFEDTRNKLIEKGLNSLVHHICCP